MKVLFLVWGLLIAALWAAARLWVPPPESPSPLYCLGELKDSAGLGNRLRGGAGGEKEKGDGKRIEEARGGGENSVAADLRMKLSPSLREALETIPDNHGLPTELQKSLLREMNRLIQGDLLYDENRWSGVSLGEELKEQIRRKPTGKALEALNRRLLDAALGGAVNPLSQKPLPTVLQWSTDLNPARKTQLAPFQLLHCDLMVKVEPVTYDKTMVQCSSGIGPDLIEIYNKSDMEAYAEAGILLDLTPYAKEMGFSTEVTYPALRGNLTVNGRQYRFPCNIGSQIIIYNKKMFREAGIAEPRDGMVWEDFIALLKPLTLKRKTGAGYDRFALVLGRDYIKDIHLQFGGHFFNSEGTRSLLDSPESIAAMRFFKDLMEKDHLIPTPSQALSLSGEGGWGFGEIRWFATGRAAAIWGARWMMAQFRQYPELKENLGCVILPHPAGRPPAHYCGARGTGVNSKTPRRAEALQFMQYLASDEYNQAIAWDSDGLPPNASFAAHASQLINPEYPWENFQEAFIRAMDHAASPETSPFIDPIISDSIWRDAVDYITNDLKTPEEAMREATKRINDRIRQNIEDRPDLRKRFEALSK